MNIFMMFVGSILFIVGAIGQGSIMYQNLKEAVIQDAKSQDWDRASELSQRLYKVEQDNRLADFYNKQKEDEKKSKP